MWSPVRNDEFMAIPAKIIDGSDRNRMVGKGQVARSSRELMMGRRKGG